MTKEKKTTLRRTFRSRISCDVGFRCSFVSLLTWIRTILAPVSAPGPEARCRVALLILQIRSTCSPTQMEPAVLSNIAEVEPATSAAPAVAKASVSVPSVLGPRANPVRVAVPVSDVQLAQFEGKSHRKGWRFHTPSLEVGSETCPSFSSFARCFAPLDVALRCIHRWRLVRGCRGVVESHRDGTPHVHIVVQKTKTELSWKQITVGTQRREVQAARESPSDRGTSVERSTCTSTRFVFQKRCHVVRCHLVHFAVGRVPLGPSCLSLRQRAPSRVLYTSLSLKE